MRKNGYQTVFLSPHPESDNFQTFVKGIGFDEVIGSKTAQNWSDRRLYENLFAEAQRLAERKRPFFLATYVLGTHVGLDSPDVKYDDGKNSFLNKFYNQDYWLGAFLQKFDASAFAKDTILVFTSDHATYPGRDFTELFGEYDYFVGEMPLIFYNKFIMPAKKDAGGLNSLALTPTILDMLGFRGEANHFLGHSLFEKDVVREAYEHFSAIGFNCFDTSGEQVRHYRFKKKGACMKIKAYYDFAG